MSDEIKKDTVDYRDPTPFDGSKLNSVSEITQAIRHKLYGKDTREAMAQSLEALVNLMQETGGNQSAEVIAARGKHKLLSMREDAQDNAIISAQSTADSKFSKADGKSYLGSITVVPETFANLAAIKAKYPSGKNGLMVAADNGHKYIWDGNVWADAGNYQAVGLLDNSVTSSQIAASTVTPENTNFAHGIYNFLNPDSVKSGYFLSNLDIRTSADYFCATIPIKGGQWYNTNNGYSPNLSYVRTVDGKVTALKYLDTNANSAFKTPVGAVELYLTSQVLNKAILLNTNQIISGASQEQYPYNIVKKLTLDNLYIPSSNKYLVDILNQLETKTIDYHNVINLKESLINITDKFYLLTSGNLSITDSSVKYHGNTKYSGFYTSNFNSSSTGGIRAHLTGEFDGASSINAGVFYTKSDGSRRFNSNVTIDKSPFDVTFDFDQNQLAVYNDATNFSILMQNNESVDTTITLETIAVTTVDVEHTDIYANNLADVMININNKLNNLKSANRETSDKLIDVDGDKYHLQMSNGNLITVPTIPKKVLFLGNSLLLGLYQGEHGTVNFGMCASDSKHDYYHLVSQAILNHNSTAEINKIHDAVLEQGQSTAAKYMTDNATAFAKDLDLIIIQIGDNVSTADLQNTFKNEFTKLITSIRTQCPQARVIVVGTWAGHQYGYPVVTDISARFGCEFIDISDLNVAANQSKQGAIITFDDGTTTIAKDNWITHPGDQGHKLISDRLIAKLDM